MAEGPIQILCLDPLFGRIQRDTAGEAFPKYLERDHQIRFHHLAARNIRAGYDAGGRIPRQKLRVRPDIRHQIIHLGCRVWQDAGFMMFWHWLRFDVT